MLLVSDVGPLPLAKRDHLVLADIGRLAHLLNPLGHFELLDEPVVVVCSPFLLRDLRVGQLHAGRNIFAQVASLVHLLKQGEFLFVAGKDFV